MYFNRQPSTVNRQPSTVNRQPSTVNRQPSTVNRQPSTVNRQPSTVNRQPSTVMDIIYLEQLLAGTQSLEAQDLFRQLGNIVEKEDVIEYPEHTVLYRAESILLQISLALLYRDFLKNCSAFSLPKINFAEYLNKMDCPSNPFQIGYLLGKFGLSQAIEKEMGLGRCILLLIRVAYRQLILQMLEEELGYGRMMQLFSQSERSSDWTKTTIFFESLTRE